MKSDKTESSSNGIGNLVVVKEVRKDSGFGTLSSFFLGSQHAKYATFCLFRHGHHLILHQVESELLRIRAVCSILWLRFSTLIEDMVQAVNKLSFDLVIKASMSFCTETLNWLLLKESVLNILLSSVRTRRSNEKSDGATLEGMLNNFSTAANTKNIVKRVTSGAAQLLLAHAFQVSSLDSL
ncbi:hypothetical protein B296_00046230 [Ensete ventricosum]|uniref:Uncharacterized protein n=1 Tax=Ensete ventricosum TaxID=4639 RepID=A0A426YBV3_ENSVE|nr:hypothetical protein B296_00046230 [Ensete ventricosum]